GVLVDRWDRKRVMVACDIGRGVVLAFLPWVDTVGALVFASFLLEVLTLLWAPAKEASVPNLVPPQSLATANSLSLVAAYGTFPIGSAAFALLAGVAKWLGGYEALKGLRVSQESVAIWFDVGTFFLSALLISTVALPRTRTVRERSGPRRIRPGLAVQEVREGFRFIGQSPVVRAVMVAIATGLIGGGMLIPLGPLMSDSVLGGGPAGFGLLITALGTGAAVGIMGLSAVQRWLPRERTFILSVFGAGISIILGASMSTLTPALIFVALLGVCAGGAYVLGFTILQTSVDDTLRGRIFATFYTLVRFCLLLAFALAPFLSAALEGLSSQWVGGRVEVFGVSISVPGVRLTLWLGGIIIMVAGALAVVALRSRAAAADT
ncbi:MAG: MFS transporter, partial [Acidimicrobiales bacterium]